MDDLGKCGAMDGGQSTLQHASRALEELVRRAKLQANELSMLIHRLEQLHRDIDEHLYQQAAYRPR
jgi:tRNA C32,U32 (ribose-2'-O)-methylase TrmJ